jgi:hypothetical protein
MQNGPYFGENLPPGHLEEAAGTAPPAVIWFRVYAAVLGLVYVVICVLGIITLVAAIATPPKSAADQASGIGMALVFVVIGGALAVPCFIALFGGRKPWVWTLDIVLIAIGMSSACCMPICIPLLIYWMKPEVKAWFGKT